MIPPKDRVFAFALVVVGIITCVRFWHTELAFIAVLFGDQGWPLAVDELLDQGLTPTIDFGYYYGLLPLVLDRVWFVVLGRTPEAAAWLVLFLTAFVFVGMYRSALALNVATPVRVLLLCAIPIALPTPFPTPVHAFESALLVNALAFQARGRLNIALVLVVFAVTVKPSLGYFYGLVLVLLILAGYGGVQGSFVQRLRQFVPATIVGLVLLLGLGGYFGFEPLRDTLFPTSARKVYAEEGFGFFGTGRSFWLLKGGAKIFYVLAPVGFWLAGTLLLWVRSLHHATKLGQAPDATIVTAAILHAVFVFLMFGSQLSWFFYAPLLVLGLAGVLQGNRPLTVAFCIAALLAMFAPTMAAWHYYQKWERSAATANLFADPSDVVHWQKVRNIAANERVFVFSQAGAAHQAFPEVDSPRAWFLLRGSSTPSEIERVREQLQAAQWVVVPKGDPGRPAKWPEFAGEMKAFQFVSESWAFTLYQRR